MARAHFLGYRGDVGAVIRDAADLYVTFVSERFAMARFVSSFESVYYALLDCPRGEYCWLRGSTWLSGYTTWLAGIARRLLRQGLDLHSVA